MTNLINSIKNAHYQAQDAVQMRDYKGLRKIDAYAYYFIAIIIS